MAAPQKTSFVYFSITIAALLGAGVFAGGQSQRLAEAAQSIALAHELVAAIDKADLEPRFEISPQIAPNDPRWRNIGPVTVIDGDTIDGADGTRYRLAGIDTPEANPGLSNCVAATTLGKMAKEFVTAHVAEKRVEAAVIEQQRPRAGQQPRMIAVVRVEGVDLAKTLKNEGFARDSGGRRYPWCNGR